MREWIRNHRGAVVALAIGFVGLVVFVLVWFEPQKAFIDERVDEAFPGDVVGTTSAPATTTSTVPPTTTTQPPETTTQAPETTTTTITTSTTSTTTTTAGPMVLSDTQFASVGHEGSGRVLLIELPDGSRTVRLEDLDVGNGPDLFVILSPSPLVDDRNAYDDGDFVNLGELKGNQGNQNYEIPSDVDLGDFGSVAIWCRRFNYTFNAAAIDYDSV